MTNKFTGSGGVVYYYTDNSLPFSWNPVFTAPFNQNTALGVISRVVTVNPTTAPYGRQSFNCFAKAITDVIISVINTENNLNPTLSTTNGVSGNGSAALPLQMSQSWLDGKYRLVANTSSTFVIDMATSEFIINNRTSSSPVLPITSLPFVLTGTTLRNTSDIFVLHKGYYSEWLTNSTITLTANAVNYVFFRLVGNAYQLMSTTSTSLYNLSDVLLGTVNTSTSTVNLNCKILWDGFEPTTGVTSGGLGTTQCVSLAPLIPTFDIGFYNSSAGTGNKLTSVNEGTTFYLVIKTTNAANGTQLPISFSGTANAADFGWSSFPTSMSVTNNIATLGITATNDSTTEGDETLIVSITSEITTGTLTIVDTSGTPAPVYTLARSAATVLEGASVTFTLTYSNNVHTGNITRTITGVQAEDIDIPLTENFTLPIGNGTKTWVVTTVHDGIDEPDETMTFSIGAPVSQSTSVVIQNRETAYQVGFYNNDIGSGAQLTQVNEGSTFYYVLKTFNVPIGRVLNLSYSGTSTAADFQGTRPSTITVNGTEISSVQFQMVNDLATEGTETFAVTATDVTNNSKTTSTGLLQIMDTSNIPVPTYSINIYTDSAGNNLAPTPLASGTNYWVVAKTTNVANDTPINFVYEFNDGEDIDNTGGNDTINGNWAARQITTGYYDTNVVVKLRNGANNTDLATASRTITATGLTINFSDYIAYVNETAYGGGSTTRVFMSPDIHQMLCNKYGFSNINSDINPRVRINIPANCFITANATPYLGMNPNYDYVRSTTQGNNGLYISTNFNLGSAPMFIKVNCAGVICGLGGDGAEHNYAYATNGGTGVFNAAADATVTVNITGSGWVAGGGGGGGASPATIPNPTPTLPAGNRTSWTISHPVCGGGGYPYGKGWNDGARALVAAGGGGWGYDTSWGGNRGAMGSEPNNNTGAYKTPGLGGYKKSGNVTFTGNGNVYGRD